MTVTKVASRSTVFHWLGECHCFSHDWLLSQPCGGDRRKKRVHAELSEMSLFRSCAIYRENLENALSQVFSK